LIPTPRFGLAAVVGGEAADEMLIGGARVLPERLSQSGYKFEYPELEGALKHELGR
jgi:NAD dependent epimerase/dehydratase family enzyme